MIPLVPVGKSGMSVSRIGFGGAPIGDLRRTPTEAEAQKLLLGPGMPASAISTPPRSTAAVCRSAASATSSATSRADSYVLSTKVGRLLVPDRAWAMRTTRTIPRPAVPPVFDFSYDGVMKSYENSLQRLGARAIDILFLHDIGRFSQKDNHETMDAGARRRRYPCARGTAVGAVRHRGRGQRVADARRAHGPRPVRRVPPRQPLHPARPGVIETSFLASCAKGLRHRRRPAQQRHPVDRRRPGRPLRLRPGPRGHSREDPPHQGMCNRHGAPLIRAALNFPLGHPAVTALLPGMSKADQLSQNLRHLRARIPPALWTDLREAGLIHREAPLPLSPSLPEA